MRERNSNSRMVLRTTAGGGERLALVLDFEFLSRTRSAMQTMRGPALIHHLNASDNSRLLQLSPCMLKGGGLSG